MGIEGVMYSCMIDALENRDVATLDIPGAFMQALIDEEVHIKFDNELVNLMCKVDPMLKQYVAMENGKKILYTHFTRLVMERFKRR